MAESATPPGGGPEPVRVKVYGLFPLTRRRYLGQAVLGGCALVLVLALWLLVWPTIEAGLPYVRPDPWKSFVLAVAAQTPWILLGVAAFKLVEMYLVLGRFAAKEAQQAAARGGKVEGPTQPTV